MFGNAVKKSRGETEFVMIDLKLAQKQPEIIAKALADRRSPLKMDDFLALDAKRREILAEVEALKAERNRASAQVAALKRAGRDPAPTLAELGELSDRIKKLDQRSAEAVAAEEAWLYSVPNIPHPTTPQGKDESENVEIYRRGEPRRFDFEPEEHGALGARLDGLDFERAAKLTGSRFVVERGWAARLDRALVNYFLDRHVNGEDYIEISPPYMVNRAAMTGTGQLPKFEEDLFKLRDWDYYLIPTAEVPLTNLHAGEILPEAALPLAYCAATPCFRSEAGSAGKDTRGMIRMHQFTKVEMVRFSRPEESYEQLELMRGQAEAILEDLELPYRVVALCAGDLGFGATKTYDLEVWFPAQKTYREISSCSNCGDFQARRAGIKYKPASGKPAFVHTLNGSGLPSGRALAAIIENYQQKDGSIVIPKVLRPYMNGLEIVTPPNKI